MSEIETSPTNHQVVMGAKRVQNLHAIRIYACPHCQAPGVWKSLSDPNVEYFREKWAGVLIAEDDERVNQPVGDICPNCNASREEVPDEDLGVVWSREINGF